MSTLFEIETFEKYLSTVRNKLPEGRKYFRGQRRLISAGYPLKPFPRALRPPAGEILPGTR